MIKRLYSFIKAIFQGIVHFFPWYIKLYKGRAWYTKAALGITSFIVAIFLYLGMVDTNFLWLFGRSPGFIEIKTPPTYAASEIYSADSVLIGRFYKENRTPIKYGEVNPAFWNALISTEDERFYSHHGIDFMGIGGAIKDAVTRGDGRGASTITQQLAKNMFRVRTQYSTGLLGHVPGLRMLIMKSKEWIIAVKLELIYSKKDILTSKCKLQHRFELRFYKDTNYDLIRNRFLNIFRNFPIEQQTDTIEYEDFVLQTNDGQLIVPILRTFLPYIHIRSTIPVSLFTRFIKDLNDTQKPFQLQEKSKDSTSKYIKGTEESSKEATFVDPLLNELSSIIFLTQYRIQQDLINGHTYSTDDLKFICKNRPLRNPNEPELENDIFELSITKNLIINDNKKLLPLFKHLPKTIITTAEHKFIKDLIMDERVNWMLSPILQTKLIEATQSIENTLPDTLWHNKTITTDESLNTIESLTICHNAIINEESILCEHNGKNIELLPYKLEYNVATNGFNILAYSIANQTFEYYSINTLNSITAIKPSISIDLNSRYLKDFENEQLSATFEIYDIKNAIDRCFTAFTNYEITGNEIIPNSNIYTITVPFKTYQQKDLINRLLSLGSAIHVKAPDVLANQINQIFIKAIERHTSQ